MGMQNTVADLLAKARELGEMATTLLATIEAEDDARFAVGRRARLHGRDVGCPQCALVHWKLAGTEGVIKEISRRDGPLQPHVYRLLPDGWHDPVGINGIWSRADEMEPVTECPHPIASGADGA